MPDYKEGLFKMGRCNIIVTIDNGRWHLSISTRDPKILPSYKEIKAARYKYTPNDVVMAEIFPPKEEFVSIAEVRHLWEIRGIEHEPNIINNL
jgi:hypothetical protein